jgi:lysozyme family protein
MAKSKKIGKILSPAEYVRLYSTMKLDGKKISQMDLLIDQKIIPNKSRYVSIRNELVGSPVSSVAQNLVFANLNNIFSIANVLQTPVLPAFTFTMPPAPVADTKGIPWFVIALIHYIECDFNFSKHLFNGDSLKNYTQKFPPGYPKVHHKPPFTFDESAVDALKYEGFDKIDHWSVPVVLKCLEKYNGFGYEMYQNMNSPYLWSGSDIYKTGKYIEVKKKGVWKSGFYPKAVSGQLGTAVILKRMETRGLINIIYN